MGTCHEATQGATPQLGGGSNEPGWAIKKLSRVPLGPPGAPQTCQNKIFQNFASIGARFLSILTDLASIFCHFFFRFGSTLYKNPVVCCSQKKNGGRSSLEPCYFEGGFQCNVSHKCVRKNDTIRSQPVRPAAAAAAAATAVDAAAAAPSQKAMVILSAVAVLAEGTRYIYVYILGN